MLLLRTLWFREPIDSDDYGIFFFLAEALRGTTTVFS